MIYAVLHTIHLDLVTLCWILAWATKWEQATNTCPLQEQPVLFTPALSLQPHKLQFWKPKEMCAITHATVSPTFPSPVSDTCSACHGHGPHCQMKKQLVHECGIVIMLFTKLCFPSTVMTLARCSSPLGEQEMPRLHPHRIESCV